MATPYMQYELGDGRAARWHGGEYIEVGYLTAEVETPDAFVAEDVINVWDYAAGAPTILRTLGAFRERVDAWLLEED